MTGQPVLEVEGLRKSYGQTVAVDGVDLRVSPGEVFGLLGPNGAGKSTTIGCVCGLLEPDAGRVRLAGQDLKDAPLAARLRLGVVPQELALYDPLTVRANLEAFGGLYGLTGSRLVERVAWCLDFAQLGDRAADRVASLSGGMRRRLNLAAALLHDPDLILADEPTVGVDPQSRNHIFDAILALAAAGKAVVYTTHYMEEVERLCARAAIIDHGRVIAADSLPELLKLAEQAQRLELGWTGGPPEAELVAALVERFEPTDHTLEGGRLELSFHGPVPVSDLVGWLAEQGRAVAEVHMRRPTLEDAFLRLTGRTLRDG
jgi:linearmycin/streptolysin S transport system ATP-binding protein